MRASPGHRQVSLAGLVGVVVVFVAIGSMHALQAPPFSGPDEAAHLAYAHAVADLSVPGIDDPQPVPPSAGQWIVERDSAPTARHRSVWVANHPPLHYVLVAPLAALAEVIGRPDGGLLFLRLANVSIAAVGVVMTYLLAVELTGLRRLALLTAAAAALTTQAQVVFAQGMNDGSAFAAGTALIWAGVRCIRAGPTRGNLVLLGVAATAAAGVRAATMVLAVAVVGTVAVDRFVRGRDPVAIRRRAAARIMASGLFPAVALLGWFYVRNVVRYGDIGGSRYLMDRFGRTPPGSLFSVVADGDLWVELFQRLQAPNAITQRHPPLMVPIGVAAIAGLVAVVVTRRTGDRDRSEQPVRVSRRSVALLVMSVLAIAATFAQHVSAGGVPHPRYLLPVLGALATLIMVGLDRLVPRLLPAVLVVAMGWWALAHVPSGVEPAWVYRHRDQGAPAPELLRVLPTGAFWRALAGCGIVVGCLVALAAMTLALFSSPRPSVHGAARLVPGITDRLAVHVPAPGHGRDDPQIVARTDQPVSLDRRFGPTVDTDAARDEGLERDQVVDHERDVGIARDDVADLARGQDRVPRSADPELLTIELERDRDDVGLPGRSSRREPGERLRA